MRILHVITSLRIGGAEKFVVDLLPRIKDFGNEIELVVFDGIRTPFFEELERKGIRIHSFGINGSVYNPINIIKLIPLMKKFDIIHTHNTAPQLFAAIAHLFVPNCKLFTTEHNSTNRRRKIKGLFYVDKWMYNQYHRITCVSKQTEINLRGYLNCQNDKINTIFNGIDVVKYMHAKPITEITERFEGCYLGMMVSRFRKQKDQHTLIKAYKELPPNFHLLLVGIGETEDECKQLAKSLSINDRVHFFGTRTDIPQLLHTADVIIMSSHYEGLSLSSIEGMACGKPFIASDVDGLRECVAGYGVLVPHLDVKSLALEIQKATTDRLYRKKIISLCQERAKMFDISTMVQKYNQLYINI